MFKQAPLAPFETHTPQALNPKEKRGLGFRVLWVPCSFLDTLVVPLEGSVEVRASSKKNANALPANWKLERFYAVPARPYIFRLFQV